MPFIQILASLCVNIYPKTIPSYVHVSFNEIVFQLLSKTLATMDDGKWVCQLAAEATGYLSTYNHALEEKARAELLMYKSHRKVNFGHLS